MLQIKGTGDEFYEVSSPINYMQHKICSLINYDVLTGLANRNHFLEQLELLVRAARRENNQHSILFIDLDGFKQVNDTYGNQGGDALLKTVGKRLKETIRESDCAARLGERVYGDHHSYEAA